MDLEFAGEGGSPAFLEDRAVQSFDVSVGLRAPGADLAVTGSVGQAEAERPAAEFVAVIGRR